MKNIITIIVIVALAIFGIVMYVKNVQLNNAIDVVIEEFDTQSLIDECINSSYDAYVKDWNKACSDLGLADNCLLPAYKHERIDLAYKEAQDRCVERFK